MSGFKHSIKVPSKYKKTAAILKIALENKRSLKSLIFEQKKHVKLRDMQALLTHYTDNQRAIDAAIQKCQILEENPRLSRELCITLVTELIYHRKELKGDSKPVQTVRAYRERIMKALGDENLAKKKDAKPRYVRINTHLVSIADAHAFLAEDWCKKDCPPFEKYDDFLKAVETLEENEYMVDMHVDDLLIFNSKQKYFWATHPWVTESKKFMLQDKATCLAAKILNPPIGSIILDMCAAPGMKTIHLSNCVNNQGTIYAIEKDAERYRLLRNMTKKAKCKNIKPIEADVLTVTPEQCPDVEYILLDPPCSGSGMQNRMCLNPEVDDAHRLQKLGGLQIKLLNHAMNFPHVKRIVYSTCSIHKEENEDVVKKCLYLNPTFKLLSAKKALRNKWCNLGDRQYDFGKKCLYSRPEKDLTIGMFIAIFEKCPNAEELT